MSIFLQAGKGWKGDNMYIYISVMLKWMTELLIEHCFLQYVVNLPGIFWILIKTFSLQPMVLNSIKTTVSIFGIV
jgi:hypothetical protein